MSEKEPEPQQPISEADWLPLRSGQELPPDKVEVGPTGDRRLTYNLADGRRIEAEFHSSGNAMAVYAISPDGTKRILGAGVMTPEGWLFSELGPPKDEGDQDTPTS